jgi:hypothetical protein
MYADYFSVLKKDAAVSFQALIFINKITRNRIQEYSTIYVGFVLDKVEMGQVFLRGLH